MTLATKLAIVLGLSFALLLGSAFKQPFLTGKNEFVFFYSGGKMANSPGLYDTDQMRSVQRHYAGTSSPGWPLWTRLPFYAAILHPLASFPYKVSYWIWESLLALSALVFIWLWSDRNRAAVAVLQSIPAWVCWIQGQDSLLLLLIVGLSIWLHRCGLRFQAGLVLSLGMIKPHLFVLVPLLFVHHSLVVLGCTAGSVGLLIVSILMQPKWLSSYHQILTNSAVHPNMDTMTTLAGSIHNPIVLALLSVVVAILILRMNSQSIHAVPFEVALGSALTGGLLIGYHAYVNDAVLLIPAGLAVWESETRFAPLRPSPMLVGLLVSFPLACCLALLKVPFALPCVILLFLIRLTLCHRRVSHSRAYVAISCLASGAAEGSQKR